ncbi:hypothetical protein GCM10022226_39990 [Sphaerisporangium flaviroseum]|uniref:Intein C-terminal splicing domain-containing protein n=1 Tax=Sphaerisporangium flaviroseum TaxID=509199 RepID=A0ABP7ICS7_9ACTN
MADGTHKPINQVQVGDWVTATDPETGQTGPRLVLDLIRSNGNKGLVEITVEIVDGRGHANGMVITTDKHPFWASGLHRWVNATELQTGMVLQTSAGAHVRISAVKKWTERQQVYNLSVAGIPTFFVRGTGVDLLVHNSPCNRWGVGGKAPNAPSKRNPDGGMSPDRETAVKRAREKMKEHDTSVFREECGTGKLPHVHVDVYNNKGQVIETWHYPYPNQAC